MAAAQQADMVIGSFLLDSDSDREFWENLNGSAETTARVEQEVHLYTGETTAREKQWEQQQFVQTAGGMQTGTSTTAKRPVECTPTVSPLAKGTIKRFRDPPSYEGLCVSSYEGLGGSRGGCFSPGRNVSSYESCDVSGRNVSSYEEQCVPSNPLHGPLQISGDLACNEQLRCVASR